MPSFEIHNIPEDLLLQIQQLARSQDRTLDAQVITLLTQVVQLEKVKDRGVQLKRLASIHPSLALLFEDRKR